MCQYMEEVFIHMKISSETINAVLGAKIFDAEIVVKANLNKSWLNITATSAKEVAFFLLKMTIFLHGYHL